MIISVCYLVEANPSFVQKNEVLFKLFFPTFSSLSYSFVEFVVPVLWCLHSPDLMICDCAPSSGLKRPLKQWKIQATLASPISTVVLRDCQRGFPSVSFFRSYSFSIPEIIPFPVSKITLLILYGYLKFVVEGQDVSICSL